MNHGGHPNPAMMGAPQQPLASDLGQVKHIGSQITAGSGPVI